MTLHQINADRAGPMTCSVSTDASSKTFTAMTTTMNVPGTNVLVQQAAAKNGKSVGVGGSLAARVKEMTSL